MVAKEALVWSRLQHPHILPLLGVCLMADVPFLVMPLMAGGDLPEYTKDKSAHDQLRALHEAAQGVAYLHSQKIFHGDLKGNNVLVDEYGRVQVSDFGQSRVLSMSGSRVSTFDSGSVGNVRWIAPERYEHAAEYQFEPDVFGFAMVMYEVLSGNKIPFQDNWRATDDLIRAWYCQGTRPTVPEEEFAKFGPVDVWEVVTDCWQQDWKARPTMVMVVRKLKELATALASVPVAAAANAVADCEPQPAGTRELPALATSSDIAPPPAYGEIHPLLRADSAVANVFTPSPAPSPAALADSITSLSLDGSSARTVTSQPQPIPDNLFTVSSPHHDSFPLATDPDPFTPLVAQLALNMDPFTPLPRATLNRGQGRSSSVDSTTATTGPPDKYNPHTHFDRKESMDPSVPAPVVAIVRAKFPYTATVPEEITFAEGDSMTVVEQHPNGWWTVHHRDPSAGPSGTRRGLIPSNFVEVVWQPPGAEL